jgi:hypothetical protein
MNRRGSKGKAPCFADFYPLAENMKKCEKSI